MTDENRLIYIEQGHLMIGDYSGEATQRLIFNPVAGHPAVADVRFGDGRDFYRLDLTTGHGVTRHECAPDIYDVETLIISQDHWQQTWRVRGPAKDQLITSIFHRQK